MQIPKSVCNIKAFKNSTYMLVEPHFVYKFSLENLFWLKFRHMMYIINKSYWSQTTYKGLQACNAIVIV